ncbi:AAA family ATPase [Lachnospiraceae bacterium 48-42]
MDCTLFTYRNLEELRKIQEEREVFAFIFGETKDMLDSCSDVCIDISALVYFLLSNKNNIELTYINFTSMAEDTVVIAEAAIVENAIELLPLLFSGHKCYFEEDDERNSSTEEKHEFKPYPRQKIYKYNNMQDLDIIIRYAETNDIPISTFSQAGGELRKVFEQFNNSSKLAILDLTSVSYAIEDNKALIYALEQFLSIMPNIRVIAQTVQIDVLLKYFPLFLDGQEPVCKLLPDLSSLGEKEPEDNKLTKVTDLSAGAFDTFIDTFNHNLIGHKYFKDRLRYALKNFIFLNKAKEQKILSIFLFGPSGIGKTEVARLIASGLQNDCYLAKINFQNYSSQDALNSLIGSPAGYVGCNHGELSEKIKKSKVGVLLCDEFEKTTRPVLSFFLELLEEGRFTDSMTREYDMNGYVIIFTSNLLSEAEYKKAILPELQTRIDLVCEFEEPTMAEKTAFLDLLLEKAKIKYSEQFTEIEMTEDEKKQLYAFEYSSISALRDIKRVFNNRLMDYFTEKGVLR